MYVGCMGTISADNKTKHHQSTPPNSTKWHGNGRQKDSERSLVAICTPRFFEMFSGELSQFLLGSFLLSRVVFVCVVLLFCHAFTPAPQDAFFHSFAFESTCSIAGRGFRAPFEQEQNCGVTCEGLHHRIWYALWTPCLCCFCINTGLLLNFQIQFILMASLRRKHADAG